MAGKGNFVFVLFYLLCWQFNCIAAFFGGAWCPYKMEKMIPCRVQNGTESYLGPNICWRNFNGSFHCTKKTLNRPKFVTTYKKVTETMYKCCPGLQGHNCQSECFNCTSFKAIQNRLGQLETKMNEIQVFPASNNKGNDQGSYGSGLRESMNTIGDDDDEDLASVLNIAEDLRTIERRLVRVESQLANILNTIDKFVNAKTMETAAVMAEEQKGGTVPGLLKKAEDKESFKNVQPNDSNSQRPSVRPLESNLDRGDIASTLNDDDYGDDQLLSSHAEEYVDQLYAHAAQ